MSNGPQKVTEPIFVNPPPEGLLNNAKAYLAHCYAKDPSVLKNTRELEAVVFCYGRAATPAEVCFGEIFGLEFDLKFEISDGKNLVKFLGRTFRPARKARKISGRISEKISEQISFQISRLFSETSFSRRAVLILLRP